MPEKRVPDRIEVDGTEYLSVREFATRSGNSVFACRKAALRGQIPGFRDQRGRVWLPASALALYPNRTGPIKLVPIVSKER